MTRPGSEQQLLPCPFCGGEAMTEFAQTPEGDGAYFVHCQNDGCPAWPNTQGDTEAEAITAWNQRHPDTQALVEAALAVLQHKDRPPEQAHPDGIAGEVKLWADFRQALSTFTGDTK